MSIVAGSRKLRRWPFSRASGVALLAVALSACLAAPAPTATPTPTAPPSPTPPAPQRLRIRNAGTTEIKGLVVGFAIDNIAFGDLAPGATTDYQAVPHGVLAYAAYRFQMDGREVGQPVMDFIGEQPLPGRDFTYSVDYDPGRWSQNEAIRLLGVTRDQ